MKNNLKTLTLIFVLLLVSEVRGQILQSDSTKAITEPIEVYPFAIKRKSIYVDLPIKLRGTGLGVIKLYLDEKGELLNMNIQKLKMRLRNGTIIDFYTTDSLPKYPNKVKQYYQPLIKYINAIEIMPVSNANLSKKTSISLMVRFK